MRDPVADFASHDRHRRGDLGSDDTLEVRAIVHVLDQQAVEPGLLKKPALGGRLLDDLVDRVRVSRGAGKGVEMENSDERSRHPEDRLDGSLAVQAGEILTDAQDERRVSSSRSRSR